MAIPVDWEKFARGIERTTGMVQGTIMQAYQQEKENEEWQRRQMVNEGRMVRLEQMRFKNQKAATEFGAKLQNDLTLGRQKEIMKLGADLEQYDGSFEVMSLYEDPENPFGRVVYGDKKAKLQKGELFDDRDREDIKEHLPQQVAMKLYELEQQERIRQQKFQQDQDRINASAERWRMYGEKDADVATQRKRIEMDKGRVSRDAQIVQYDKDILKLEKEQTKLEQKIIKEAGIEYQPVERGGRKGRYRGKDYGGEMTTPQSLLPNPGDTPLVASYKEELGNLRARLEEIEVERMAYMRKMAGVAPKKPEAEKKTSATRDRILELVK